MKSAEEVLNDFPLLKSYKGYSVLVACLEMAGEDEGRLVHIRKAYLYSNCPDARGDGTQFGEEPEDCKGRIFNVWRQGLFRKDIANKNSSAFISPGNDRDASGMYAAGTGGEDTWLTNIEEMG